MVMDGHVNVYRRACKSIGDFEEHQIDNREKHALENASPTADTLMSQVHSSYEMNTRIRSESWNPNNTRDTKNHYAIQDTITITKG